MAEELGIPRSTLRYWIERKDSIDAAPELVNFLESPVGIAFLHRIVVALHYVMTKVGPGSVHNVCTFLELTRLDRFVASSYGSNQKTSTMMDDLTIQFGELETKRLAGFMTPKDISLIQDETFHPEICLVAMEALSNYILIEKYSKGRKASDWHNAIQEATKDLPVNIIQSVSDEGRGILNHVKNNLGAHHSPDVFHVQREISKGTCAPLCKKAKHALQDLEKASENVNQSIDKNIADDTNEQVPEEALKSQEIENALLKETQALESLETAQSHQKRMKQAVKRISNDYHPVDIETGVLKTPEDVADSLEQSFHEIENIAKEAELSEKSMKRVQKAKKVVVDMLATIYFFMMIMNKNVEALNLPEALELLVTEKMIPANYLFLASQKAKSASERERLKRKADEIFVSINELKASFPNISQDEWEVIENVARDCAGVFQRSSSCVEGRNGQLALRHRSLHRLSNRKLAALTVIHNFFIRRKDNTTAAERFFGAKPNDLFEFLLENVDLPRRPAKKRAA